jgi:putative tryptophan/tyrosine transport system substrate-binding protein
MLDLRRREFLTLLGGAATAWPCEARAQQSPMPVIGFLSSGSPVPFAPQLAGFRRGLEEVGYADGQNVAIEFRWADGRYDRLPGLAADLVRRQVAVIAAVGGSASGLAAKATTAAIPIVFTSGGDPVRVGLVASLNRPGGNVTGVNLFTSTLAGKRLEVLHELVPKATMIAMLVNPTNPNAEPDIKEVEAAARTIGLQLMVVRASDQSDLEAAFRTMSQGRVDALLVFADPLFDNNERDQMIALASRYSLPAIYDWRDVTAAGGLASYGSNLTDGYRLVGVYAGRILKGEKPGNLPVVQPTKLDLAINLKTARALGLDVSPTLLARADEVIE